MDQLGEDIRQTLSRGGDRARQIFSRDKTKRTAVQMLDQNDYHVENMQV